MNRLIKVIFLNLLNMFNINKVIVARENHVKSESESKLVITGIVAILFGYIFYLILTVLNVDNKMMILNLAFLLSTFICVITSLFSITSQVLKGEDSDLLLSMPLTVNQVLFSKLFQIYLKNLMYTAIIMISAIIAYGSYFDSLSDLFVLMFILFVIIIPFIPIVISTILCYFDSLFTLNLDKKLYKLARTLLVILIIMLFIIVFEGVGRGSADQFVTGVYSRFKYIYPLVVLFNKALGSENMLCFVGLLFIPSIILLIFNMVLSNSYMSICSRLKGIGKKEKFEYKKKHNLSKIGGLVRKELTYIFNNKGYLKSSVLSCMLLSILFLAAMFIIDPVKIMGTGDDLKIFNARMPSFVAMLCCIAVPSVSCMSLEQKNVQMLRTFPIKTRSIIFAKWLASVVIGSVFVLINGTIAWIAFKPVIGVVICSYLFPLASLMFVSFTGVFLDYVYVDKTSLTEKEILGGRLITMFPIILAVVIGIVPMFSLLGGVYYKTLLSYVLAMVILVIMEIIYMIVKKKRLEENLYS